jgi:hypothetical protein
VEGKITSWCSMEISGDIKKLSITGSAKDKRR